MIVCTNPIVTSSSSFFFFLSFRLSPLKKFCTFVRKLDLGFDDDDVPDDDDDDEDEDDVVVEFKDFSPERSLDDDLSFFDESPGAELVSLFLSRRL